MDILTDGSLMGYRSMTGTSAAVVTQNAAIARFTNAEVAPRRANYLDGIRGLLMFSVLVVHIFFFIVITGPVPVDHLTALRWLYPQFFVIGFFIVLSGYCLMLPVARSHDAAIRGGIPAYFRRRSLRILPPYFAALALNLAHIALFRNQYVFYPLRPNFWDTGVIWSHLLLFYNFRAGWRFAINGAYWSLAPEWQLYALFPLILVPLFSRVGPGRALALALFASAGLMLLGPEACQMHPWFLFLFVAGMGTAVLTESRHPHYSAFMERTPWGWISVALLCAVPPGWAAVWYFDSESLDRLAPTWQMYLANETLLGLALLAAIIHWTGIERRGPKDRWPLPLRLLNHRTITGLGRFSYSHYLVHLPVVISVTALVRSLHLKLVPSLALAYAIGLPVSVSAGYLFFLCLENRLQTGRNVGMQSR